MQQKWPLRFPSEADMIFREAQEFRKLTSTERWRTILDLLASGARLLAHSPNREQGEQLRQQDEQQWRKIHKDLFARHGF